MSISCKASDEIPVENMVRDVIRFGLIWYGARRIVTIYQQEIRDYRKRQDAKTR